MADDAGSSEPLSELAILMTIIVNWLMPLRWLMERQTDGLQPPSNIRQTYIGFDPAGLRVTPLLTAPDIDWSNARGRCDDLGSECFQVTSHRLDGLDARAR